ncbi:inverse autotransporter beta domain-containing protein [Blochmannia endosymbiont of Camponotus nipponensis]|uniref:inverse autotransporter beta domain-containing protein n=1 Tax=Blochmannia endosymbiont of Camponotus nipponensis TaxID=2681986 RepID=UPI001F29E278|nr:inverse autotransporter beta domain-containing protein [Blochmannia endosymbiont of Camponotus nipponensis]
MFQDETYQKEMKCNTQDYVRQTLNFSPYTTNKLRVHAYNYTSPFSSIYRSKIQLQNNSINMFHSFHTQCSTHQKNISFMQLGIHDFLSEPIFNFGGGKRHLTNDKYAIGYNTFYHCPLSSHSSQPYSINVGVEYWLYNTLFMLNNYYNLNSVFNFETSSSKKCSIHCPKSGYQIHMHTKFPYFPEFTGKIKLEQFVYSKKYKKIFNKKNNDYCISLALNYQPFPILGCNINNIFVNNKYFNTVCQVLINYQFGVPIAEQINYTNKRNKSILSDIDTMVQSPFIPTVTPCRDCILFNKHNNYTKSLQNIQKITGYPGEIKIIKIDDSDNESIQWNFQLLQNQGGNIIAITNDTYALYLPDHPITQEDKIFISYITNSNKTPQKQRKQDIPILVKDFSQKQSLNTQKQTSSSVINFNNDSEINVVKDTVTHTSMYNDDHHQTKNNMSLSNITTEHITHDTTKEHAQNVTTENDCILSIPIPPPIPLLFSEKESSFIIASSTLNDDTLPLSSSSAFHEDHDADSEENRNKKEIHDNLVEHSKVILNKNEDLSYRLSAHKQTKFSLIGTTEHINKLENTIAERKKNKYFGDMEKIFIKLNIAQSASSMHEDCITDNSSSDDDSFTSNK